MPTGASSYGGRTRASMAYLDRLAAYGDRVRVYPTDEVGPARPPRHPRRPRAGTRWSTSAGRRACSARSRQFCSGRWPDGALHLERFAAKQTESPTGGERSFELVLAGSGVTLEVPPDRSVFDVIQDAGISVLGSCHEGICGTCEQAVLEGEVDHRDSVLNESEQAANDAMMVCVSRCLSDRLVLDL